MTMGSEHEQPREEVTAEEAVTDAHEYNDGVHGTSAEDEAHAAGSEVQQDLDELVAKAAKADEYLALAQRTQADFENFRKRMGRDVAVAQERGIGKLAKELLPALDNLDRALAAAEAPGAEGGAPQPEHHLTSGIKLVHDELLAALSRAGIERFSPAGEKFDPMEHEAMVQQPVEGAESGTVVEVYQSGYKLGGTVLRPARVVVAA
ncbi:nucleotide exchange factor GrpE [Conexibacter sp. JD483]|uniref:nucleotide exchange factor GrpE n=1 Tax=unclassified Conexibacter TaxID=2627773 RepID=UPI002721E6F0|nr:MULTISPECIES: nucleotide exchange factor GrpE [unclassified Conexibacter]MDO8187036.1 nucleotide exchange factor GrpE [Conexibacter sp. CPCC 205706]MDO8200646.1 nucleotide exchange factor GrpE [Conexibacter sp. CPCC 205762]MDR9371256.1 nucleotide exchange factor GrpE [Conexibacter sp. JD483]